MLDCVLPPDSPPHPSVCVVSPQQTVPLSADQDSFFRTNMFCNYGDLGVNVKAMVDEFQTLHKSNTNVSSIEDVSRIENWFYELVCETG